jgi:polysaccharide biosynthesis protein PelF
VNGRRKICLLLEGSYPFITGGVSAWVQDLIAGTPEVDFLLFTISPKRDQTLKYVLPPNVVGHQDAVINEHRRIRARPRLRDRGPLLSDVRAMHEAFRSHSTPDITGILERIPTEYYLYDDACAGDIGWRMIVSGHLRHNPIYAFSEYFWSWKSAHDMIFTVLGMQPPEADLYHAVSTGYAGLTALCAGLRTGKPFLLTEHGLYHKEREMEIKRASFVKGYQRDMWIHIYNGISRLCYRNADLVISLFEYNRRRQIEMGAEEKRAVVIPNGIDVDRFGAVKRERRNGFHVGLVGRVVPIKDIKTFILMARIVVDRIPEARFWCIGPTDEDPAYYEDCRVLVRNFKLEGCFTFTGKADVRSYYAFLDVMLLTSVREAQPLVILEAYAAGVPVVSTKVGNVPELLDYDERLLASTKDAEKLAEAVSWIHDSPGEVEELVRRNKDKVTRFYDKRKVFAQYRDLYLSMGVPASGTAGAPASGVP